MMINGGLIHAGGHGAATSSQLSLSDGIACFVGSFSGITSTSISHNLNSTNLVIEFKDSLQNLLIPDTWSVINPNVIAVEFSPAAAGDVTILACITSGLAPITGGVNSVEGLSGIIDLDSPNDSIVITTSGQVINLNAIFTPASGALLEQKCRDITILSGLIGTGGGGGVASINNVSGIVTLASTNNGLGIQVNGQSVEFTSLFTHTSGEIIDRHTQDILNLSGLIGPGDSGQTSINGLSGLVEVTSPDGSILIGSSPQTIELSGLFTSTSGAILEQKCADINILSGMILQDSGQTSIDGISGAVSLSSPNSTVSIVVNGQTIELDGIFTWSSGQLLESLSNASGVESINGISGTIDLLAGNDGIIVTENGQVIELTTLFTHTSGQLIDQNIRDILSVSGLAGTSDAGQTSVNGLSGVISIISPDNSILVGDSLQTIELSGLYTATSGVLVQQHSIDLLTLSGLIINDSGQTSINGLSGALSITSPDGSILIGDSTLTLELSGLYTSTSGALLEQKCKDINTISGLVSEHMDSGQTSIDGVSGSISLDSPNDTISIVVNGQIIELDSIFTWTSGQILESLANASGVQTLNSISGIVDLIATNNGVAVTNNGQVIELSTLFTYTSGSIIDQHSQDLIDLSGFILSDSGQTIINGLSGVVSIISPDGSILVGDGPQSIEISGLFTQASGAVIQQHSQDLVDLSGLIFGDGGQTSINGLSGAISISGINLEITTSGQTILVSGIMNAASGAILEQKCKDIDILSGLMLDDSGQTSIVGISGVIDLDSPDGSINIGVNGQSIELTMPTSGAPSGASYLLREYNDNDHLSTARVLSATSGLRLIDFGARSNSGIVVTLDFDNDPMPSQVLIWNGSKLEWQNQSGSGGGGLTTVINGLSGILTVTSPDGTILIGDGPQTIELSGLFTAASGSVLEQHITDLLTLSGLILPNNGQTSINGLSGSLLITSPDDSILIGDNLQSIELSGLYTSASGALVEQKCRDINILSGLVVDHMDSGQTSIEGLSGVVDLDSPDGTILIDINGQIIELTTLPDAGQTSINNVSGLVSLVASNNGINVVNNSQTIELSTLFTYTSGQIIDQNSQNLIDLSGLILTDGGQTTVNGLSGVIAITSPNDSILIGDGLQSIELSGLYTSVSGALVEQKCRDIDILSGLFANHMDSGQTSIEGLSGVVDLDSPDGTVIINTNGQSIELTTLPNDGQTSVNGLSGVTSLTSPNETIDIVVNGQDIELEGIFTHASGALLSNISLPVDARQASGSITPNADCIYDIGSDSLRWAKIKACSGIFDSISIGNNAVPSKSIQLFTPVSGTEFTLSHNLSTEDFVFTMWRTNNDGDPDILTVPINVYPSGMNHAVVQLSTGVSGKIVFIG